MIVILPGHQTAGYPYQTESLQHLQQQAKPQRGLAPSHRARKINIQSFKAASIICRDFIERNQLSGDKWSAGQIYDGKRIVAEVCHNGTVWGADGREIEIN